MGIERPRRVVLQRCGRFESRNSSNDDALPAEDGKLMRRHTQSPTRCSGVSRRCTLLWFYLTVNPAATRVAPEKWVRNRFAGTYVSVVVTRVSDLRLGRILASTP